VEEWKKGGRKQGEEREERESYEKRRKEG